MSGLKSHSSQRGIGQWWMVLTIGIMVGFIFGFIVFLSRLPNDNYTLVETERGIEQVEGTDAEQYAFYDRLSDSDSLVPNAEANDLPAFQRNNSSAGKYGAAVNERPGAVEIADELTVGTDVAPVEIAAAAATTSATVTGAVASGASASGASASRTVVSGNNTSVGTVSQDTVVKQNSASTFYYLQAGAFSRADDASRLQRQLMQSGMDAFINRVAIEGKRWHRVRLGPFYDSESLGSAQARLGQRGVSYLVVRVQKG